MKLYQPFLYVGLGGTGCAIGAELERRLREEICGPDGSAFQQQREDTLRYQLPDCVQFVYADVNQAELDRLPLQVVPSPLHSSIAHLNAHYVRGLVPRLDSYPEVANSLRISPATGPLIDAWLPPPQGEPRVTPLQKGAGQLPTIGRAALFETLRNGIGPATAELKRSLGKLAGGQVATDLYRLSGGGNINPKAVDVFVAFSVAGGTGAGIFYDYLHLIGELFSRSDLRAQIYPLVLMPSAFTDGKGGGRAARLNAGRSLLDLFRLVDQQNAGDARRVLGGYEPRTPAVSEEVAVHYPVEGRIQLKGGIAQTAFLFNRPLGAEPDDLNRSIVSFVLALLGTEHDAEQSTDGQKHQSFADSFINAAVARQSMANNGVGHKGMSTALVTSLTVPVDALADVVAGRLLRAGVEDLRDPLPGEEDNSQRIRSFLSFSNIQDLLTRPVPPPAEPEDAVGAQAVAGALSDRLEAMRSSHAQLQADLGRSIPEKVNALDFHAATRQLLAEVDPFRLQRLLFGHSGFTAEPNLSGAKGLMQRRRTAPEPPHGVREAPPSPPELQDARFGLSKVRWHAPEVVEARLQQDLWFQWRGQVLWTEPWNTLAPRWTRQIDHLQESLRAFTGELLALARKEPGEFRKNAELLYRRRVGVSYLLPPGRNLEHFCDRVIRRMTENLIVAGRLPSSPRPSALLGALLDDGGWTDLFRLSHEESPELAVGRLRDQVKAEVKKCFRADEPGRSPLLPTLQELLSEAAAPNGRFPAAELEDFRGRLAGLVPADFTPQGSGRLKVLVSYAAATGNDAIENYLKEVVSLPENPDTQFEYRATSTESITVVLFCSEMGVTDVRESREVLRAWADALEAPEPEDYLRWRQRTGYRSGYLITTEEHRVMILHRFLCALWNGKAKTHGQDPSSPNRLTVRLGGVEMSLDLSPMLRSSSWADLLRAYELWTFADDERIRPEFCGALMGERPEGLSGRPRQPDDLYLLLCESAEGQIAYLEKKLDDLPSAARARAEQFRDFWALTLPAARKLPFPQDSHANFHSLRELELYFQGGEE